MVSLTQESDCEGYGRIVTPSDSTAGRHAIEPHYLYRCPGN